MGSIQAVRLASMGGLLSRGDVFRCAADDRFDARAATRTFLRRANTSEAAPWMSTPPPIRGNDSHGREDDRTRPYPPARERALSQLVAVRRPVEGGFRRARRGRGLCGNLRRTVRRGARPPPG